MQGELGVLYSTSRKEARCLFYSSGQILVLFGLGYKLLLEKEDNKRLKRQPNPRLWATCSWQSKLDLMGFVSSFGVVNSAYINEEGEFAVSFRHHGSCILLRDLPGKKKYLSGSTDAPDIRFVEDLPDEWDADGRLIYLHTDHVEEVYDYLNRWFGKEGKRFQVLEVTTAYILGGRPTW
jgi:hypothetical protein